MNSSQGTFKLVALYFSSPITEPASYRTILRAHFTVIDILRNVHAEIFYGTIRWDHSTGNLFQPEPFCLQLQCSPTSFSHYHSGLPIGNDLVHSHQLERLQPA